MVIKKETVSVSFFLWVEGKYIVAIEIIGIIEAEL